MASVTGAAEVGADEHRDDPVVRRRRLVLIGGLPGAGKTTLLTRLLDGAPPGVLGLDSEQVTRRIRGAGLPGPYRLVRPAVHLSADGADGPQRRASSVPSRW